LNTIDNRVEPAPSAYIAGVLLSKTVDGTGTLLLQGAITDNTLIQTLTGSNAPLPGEYYLAANGILQQGVDPNYLPVFCGTLVNANLFIVNPKAPEFYGHSHTLHLLEGSWADDDSANGYEYDPTNEDTVAVKILNAVPVAGIAVLKNGSLLLAGVDYDIIDNKLYLVTAPGDAVYQISPINRLVATDPEIRALAPADNNTIIRLSKVFGTTYIDTVFDTTESTVTTGRALTSISASGVITGPVIQELTAGPGISISPAVNGKCSVTNTGNISPYIDLQAINASNVLVGVSADDALFTFPAGTVSTLTGMVRLPESMNGRGFRVFVWMLDEGGALTGDIKIQPPPTGGTAVSDTLAIQTASGATAGSITECLSTTTYTPNNPGNALVTIKLSSSGQGGNNIRVCAVGVLVVDLN
jgi:hypothetical protein